VLAIRKKAISSGHPEVATTPENYTSGLQNMAVQNEATLLEYLA
jgi:hypothetical protein